MNPRAACGVVVASAMGLAACSPDRSIAPGELCLVSLDDEVYEHACQHGEHGPYQDVAALMEPAAATVAVTGAQRVLAVALPGLADDDLRSYLRYRPTRDGQHAVFSGVDGIGVPVAMWSDGEVLDATSIMPVAGGRACGPLTWVTGFVLELGRDYLIEIGPTRTTEVFLFIEHVETFGVEDWGAACEP